MFRTHQVWDIRLAGGHGEGENRALKETDDHKMPDLNDTQVDQHGINQGEGTHAGLRQKKDLALVKPVGDDATEGRKDNRRQTSGYGHKPKGQAGTGNVIGKP